MKKLVLGGGANCMAELYNGECIEILKKLIQDGKKVQAIITDPPYG